jgi:mRNA interferase MazF
VKRGEIWWIDFPAPVGRRPAVLVSRNQAYRVRTAITVVPLTRTIRGIASEVLLGPSDGVPKASAANADNIVTIPKASAVEYLATLSSRRMTDLEYAVKFSLDLP